MALLVCRLPATARGVPASFSLEKLGEFAKIITAEEARSFRESEAEWAESDNSERSFRREQPK